MREHAESSAFELVFQLVIVCIGCLLFLGLSGLALALASLVVPASSLPHFFNWTQAFVAVLAFLATVAAVIVGTVFSYVARITDRLHEHGKVFMEYPHIAISFRKVAGDAKAHFETTKTHYWQEGQEGRDPYRMTPSPTFTPEFVQKQTCAYMFLNIVDEIITLMRPNHWLMRRMWSPVSYLLANAIEFPAWEKYFIKKLRHPDYMCLYRSQREIWGTSFGKWIDENHATIIAEAVDPDVF